MLFLAWCPKHFVNFFKKKTYTGVHVRYPSLSYCNESWPHYTFSIYTQISNFMKIRPVEAHFFNASANADGQAGCKTEMTQLGRKLRKATMKVRAIKAYTWRCITPWPVPLTLVEQTASTHSARAWVSPEYVKDIHNLRIRTNARSLSHATANLMEQGIWR